MEKTLKRGGEGIFLYNISLFKQQFKEESQKIPHSEIGKKKLLCIFQDRKLLFIQYFEVTQVTHSCKFPVLDYLFPWWGDCVGGNRPIFTRKCYKQNWADFTKSR